MRLPIVRLSRSYRRPSSSPFAGVAENTSGSEGVNSGACSRSRPQGAKPRPIFTKKDAYRLVWRSAPEDLRARCKCSFHGSRGHEKLQIGMNLLLKPSYDWFSTYS